MALRASNFVSPEIFSACLAPELIDNIIYHIHDAGDRSSLVACVQVSRLLRTRSQKHLFSTTTIRFPNPRFDERARDVAAPLVDILTAHSGLAKVIRHLRILDYSVGYWKDHYDSEDYDGFPKIHRKIDTTLPLLFGRLDSLASFTLAGPVMWAEGFHHTERGILSSTLVSSLLGMFLKTKASSRRRYELLSDQRDGGPVNDEYPSLSMASVLDHDISYRGLGYLECLEFDENSTSCLHHLYNHSHFEGPSSLTLSHLRELKMCGKASDMLLLASRVITDASATLEKFTWRINLTASGEFNPSPLVALKQASKLPPLHLLFTRISLLEPFHWMTPTVNFLSAHPTLENLVIAYSACRFLRGRQERFDELSSSLDAHLAKPEYFPALHRVTVVEITEKLRNDLRKSAEQARRSSMRCSACLDRGNG
ncbi:hypothetical protein Hypma_004622 [Hypsizygus marmoreus]|uniref:F-box domain-containing protein n=1 Tax=Hypsizygus marmoreus TaxID=39966 RepID=A0A369JXP9_HYPMA|nr:hypothetical protein Hypma_004622 [Hypsizygus marmoreus]